MSARLQAGILTYEEMRRDMSSVNGHAVSKLGRGGYVDKHTLLMTLYQVTDTISLQDLCRGPNYV